MLALYKLCVVWLHDRTIKSHPICMSDIMLRRNEAVAQSDEHGKLIANWKGPYKVTE